MKRKLLLVVVAVLSVSTVIRASDKIDIVDKEESFKSRMTPKDRLSHILLRAGQRGAQTIAQGAQGLDYVALAEQILQECPELVIRYKYYDKMAQRSRFCIAAPVYEVRLFGNLIPKNAVPDFFLVGSNVTYNSVQYVEWRTVLSTQQLQECVNGKKDPKKFGSYQPGVQSHLRNLLNGDIKLALQRRRSETQIIDTSSDEDSGSDSDEELLS